MHSFCQFIQSSLSEKNKKYEKNSTNNFCIKKEKRKRKEKKKNQILNQLQKIYAKTICNMC